MKPIIFDHFNLIFSSIFRSFIRIVLMIFITSMTYNAIGSTFYVSGATGVNNPYPTNGTFSNPWEDISYALLQVQSGDIIYVFNDATYSGQITWPPVDGIKLRGYKIIPTAEFPTITGNNTTRIMLMQANNPSVALTDATEVRDFIFENGMAIGNGGGLCMIGIVGPSLINIKFKFCTSYGSGGAIYYEKRSDYLGCGLWNHYIQPCNMEGLYFQGNYAYTGSGGAVYIQGSNQNIDMDFPQIDPQMPQVRMTKCQFIENTADAQGGGMCVEFARIDANAIEMHDNVSNEGGAVTLGNAVSNFYDIGMHYNSASARGGAVLVAGGLRHPGYIPSCNPQSWYYNGIEHRWAHFLLDNNNANDGGGVCCTGGSAPQTKDYIDLDFQTGLIFNNMVANSGGGIYLTSGVTMNIFNLKIQNNTAINDGGGIYNFCDWNPISNLPSMNYHHIEQCLITDNSAETGAGGGIFTQQSFSCINSTISTNKSSSINLINYGGGIACYSYQNLIGQPQRVIPTFFNTIFWHNLSGISANQVYLDDSYCLPQFNYCDIQDFVSGTNHGFDGTGAASWYDMGWSCGPYMIEDNPDFVNLASGDYHLTSNVSPCINFGKTPLCSSTGFPQFSSFYGFPNWGNSTGGIDLDGNARVMNDIDMGVYELAAKSGITQLQVQQNNQNDGINIYPNPCPYEQPLIINTKNEFTRLTHIEIQTILGQIIYSTDLNNEQSIDLSSGTAFLPKLNGILIFRIETINTQDNTVRTKSKKVLFN